MSHFQHWSKKSNHRINYVNNHTHVRIILNKTNHLLQCDKSRLTWTNEDSIRNGDYVHTTSVWEESMQGIWIAFRCKMRTSKWREIWPWKFDALNSLLKFFLIFRHFFEFCRTVWIHSIPSITGSSKFEIQRNTALKLAPLFLSNLNLGLLMAKILLDGFNPKYVSMTMNGVLCIWVCVSFSYFNLFTANRFYVWSLCLNCSKIYSIFSKWNVLLGILLICNYCWDREKRISNVISH